ncbi:MAG: hypothetical protein NT062_12730 [Proteobacteria bacterium]|nr:hypothetical protein [Pseudomonadota bacterium]
MRRAVLVGLGLLGCGDDTPSGVRVIAKMTAAQPAYGDAPFPTDAVRDGDHLGLVVGFDAIARGHADLVARHLAALDGFGLRPVVEFFVDGDLDPTTIPAETSTCEVVCVRGVEPGSPELDVVVPYQWRYDADRQVVAGSPAPGHQLREGTRYAALLTTAVHAATSQTLIAMPAGAAANAPERWQTTAEAIDQAGVAGLAGVAVFTTAHASKTLYDARAVLAAAPAPTLTFAPALVFDTPPRLEALLGQATRATSGPRAGLERWGTDNATGMAHDHIAVVATGRMSIARFRGDDTMTDGPEDETFQLGGDGKPTIRATELIPVTFVLPTGAPPPAGFPVVMFGHGLGGSRTSMLNLAEPLAAQGYAVVAIDLWGHGSRFADVDGANNLGGKPAFTGDRALVDGFGDDPGYAAYLGFFEGFLNVAAIRDAIRQSALDMSQLARLLTDPALDLGALAAPYGAAPKLDTTHLAYLGESFGTIVGSDLAAIEPAIGLYVLDVPGGGLLDQIMPQSASIGTLAIPFVEQIYRTRGTLDRFHPILALMQAVFDGADPLTFAPHVLRDRAPGIGPRNVVAIEVVGDEIMANAGTLALARAFGLGLLVPSYDDPSGLPPVASPATANVDGQTGVLVQYAPATHGYNWSAERGKLEYLPGFPHDPADPFPKLPAAITIDEPIYETLDQVTSLLASYRTGTPSVRLTKTPAHDFDNDGRPDDTDPSPYDPAN